MQNTLDPPGTIAVLGGGPVGIEAALYARYLGYQVQLFEQSQLAHRLLQQPDGACPQPCTSALGTAALAAQRNKGTTSVELETSSRADWLREYFEPLASCDLLSGRVHANAKVVRIELASPEESESEVDTSESETETTDEIPPDFLIHFVREGMEEAEVQRFECVVDARGAGAESLLPKVDDTAAPPDYYFPIGAQAEPNSDYSAALGQIRDLFAALQGRPSLDVYKNLGG